MRVRPLIDGKPCAVPLVAILMLLTAACFTVVTDEDPQSEERGAPVYKISGLDNRLYPRNQPQAFSLTIDGAQVLAETVELAHGIVEVSPAPDESRNLYASGTEVTLAATPDVGYAVLGWRGDCARADGDVCTVNMDANKNVSVAFRLLPISTIHRAY